MINGLYKRIKSVVDVARLTGWVKPGEIWQLNFWIWILQAKENYFRIQCSMKIWTLLRSFYPERFLFSRVFAHSNFPSAYHFLAFLILIFYGIAFRIKKNYTRSVTIDTFNWLRRIFFWPEKVGESLATGWLVTVANFAPHFSGRKFLRENIWRKIF